MHIHILGIAGTFMGGIALIAKELGFEVSGQDENIYPPMSDQLSTQNITWTSGYSADDMPKNADVYIIGNAISRGNQCFEYILDNNLNYTSAPQWLGENVLKNKWVIAVSGTHGKTTTSSIITHILQENGFNPSFLIGGVANNLGVSSRLTDSLFFVIEADEYDTALFDKRSKFIHYYPNTLVINNIEFDHADIFNSIDDIYKQFNHLIRTLPKNATIIYPKNDKNIQKVLDIECYSKTINFEIPEYQTIDRTTHFAFRDKNITTQLLGAHNIANSIAAMLAANNAGIEFDDCITSLSSFSGVKRRMEVKYQSDNLVVYDDFAHHPTSIKSTIAGLRKQIKNKKIIVVLELRSNTMKTGVFNDDLIDSLRGADKVLVFKHLINATNTTTYTSTDAIITALQNQTGHIIFMSNGGFENIINRFIQTLQTL